MPCIPARLLCWSNSSCPGKCLHILSAENQPTSEGSWMMSERNTVCCEWCRIEQDAARILQDCFRKIREATSEEMPSYFCPGPFCGTYHGTDVNMERLTYVTIPNFFAICLSALQSTAAAPVTKPSAAMCMFGAFLSTLVKQELLPTFPDKGSLYINS
jgi:hypothetical protein